MICRTEMRPGHRFQALSLCRSDSSGDTKLIQHIPLFYLPSVRQSTYFPVLFFLLLFPMHAGRKAGEAFGGLSEYTPEQKID